jgi:hypothetical protein
VEYTANQKLRAESKESMRLRGVASPDRADAIFCGNDDGERWVW